MHGPGTSEPDPGRIPLRGEEDRDMTEAIRQEISEWVQGAEFAFVRNELSQITAKDIASIRVRGDYEIPDEWGTDEEIARFVRGQA
jgi:hypothetical protein